MTLILFYLIRLNLILVFLIIYVFESIIWGLILYLIRCILIIFGLYFNWGARNLYIIYLNDDMDNTKELKYKLFAITNYSRMIEYGYYFNIINIKDCNTLELKRDSACIFYFLL